jgi:hypothetical protein
MQRRGRVLLQLRLVVAQWCTIGGALTGACDTSMRSVGLITIPCGVISMAHAYQGWRKQVAAA